MALSFKVFPGTPYYTTSALTTEAGTIVNTIPATYVNTTYGTVSIGGTTYYVAYGQMISFWNSSFTGQQIDDSITKVRAASATPAQSGTDLFTTGGAYALQTAIGGKADKTDLSDISQSGSTCTEANGIAAGLYFYLDGDLVVAKTAIGYGDTFTENTNYETPTAGALNALKSALTQITEYSGSSINVPSLGSCFTKCGYMFIRFYDFYPTAASGVLGTIPAGLRPPAPVYGIISTTDTSSIAFVAIDPMGIVSFSGATPNKYHYGQLCYPIGN